MRKRRAVCVDFSVRSRSGRKLKEALAGVLSLEGNPGYVWATVGRGEL